MGQPIDLASTVEGPVAILGLGQSGRATASALRRSGIEIRTWDDDADARAAAAALGIPICDLLDHSFDGVRLLVLSPGIPHTWPAPHPAVERARAADVEIVGDIELLMRACPDARYIGVTGTNGKSTTTSLIGHILNDAGPLSVGGNIGKPALDLPALTRGGTYVLELSSYQLELIPTGVFDMAVLLNISADHTERHGNLNGYVAAKARIFDRQDADCTAVIGVDDESSRGLFDRLFKRPHGQVIAVSGERVVRGGVYAENDWLIDDRKGRAEPVLNLVGLHALPGRHNAQNLAAAYVATSAAGLPTTQITGIVPTFPGLPHRQEVLGSVDGILFINDSKATNMAAVAKALSCYEDIIWIAGGQPKAVMDADDIVDFLPRVRSACLIGDAAQKLAALLEGRVPLRMCGDLPKAIEIAASIAREARTKPVVLLSPGCASFDQFANFEDRGMAFRHLVAALPGKHRSIGDSAVC